MSAQIPGHARGTSRLFYRKEKLQGACWEYEIAGGWLRVPVDTETRLILRHAFRFYRPREATRRTCTGSEVVQRSAAEQWFFPDRWFSLLRFTTDDDRTIGYYVNFSKPLSEVRRDYYADIDLELDLWVDLDGTVTELDRDEFEREIHSHRLPPEWAEEVTAAADHVMQALAECVRRNGPDVEATRDPTFGIPEFILRA
jgi:predicted RNA-binding protein associated with RNAse of E/G family